MLSMAVSGPVRKEQDRGDLVAYWSVPLCDGVHTVEFEHGTLSGKRVLRIDGKVFFWSFLESGSLHASNGMLTSFISGNDKERLDV